MQPMKLDSLLAQLALSGLMKRQVKSKSFSFERILEERGIKLGVAYSPDRENFVFTMYNKQGEADYTVIVPVHVNVAEIMEETGALNILRNPTQLSKGIPGQGIGDTDWRYKSFSQLTGIKLASARIQLRPEVPLVFPNARF